jgi:hypothetical protein
LATSQEHLLTPSPNNDLNSNLVAPPSMLICFFPSPDSVDLQNVLALVTDFDAFGGNGSTEDDGHEVVLNGAFFKVRDIETYSMSVVEFFAPF